MKTNKKKIGKWTVWYDSEDDSVKGHMVKGEYSLWWEVDGVYFEEQAKKLISEWKTDKDINEAVREIASSTWWTG